MMTLGNCSRSAAFFSKPSNSLIRNVARKYCNHASETNKNVGTRFLITYTAAITCLTTAGFVLAGAIHYHNNLKNELFMAKHRNSDNEKNLKYATIENKRLKRLITSLEKENKSLLNELKRINNLSFLSKLFSK